MGTTARGPYRILALDGGGIRGLLTAVLLERLELEVPGFLERVDLFAGTSTGGILALALAAGRSPSDMIALYRRRGRAVFAGPLLDRLGDLGGLRGARYDARPLARALGEVFGDARLADLPRRVLVPAFDLDNEGAGGAPRHWKPKFFHNFPGPGGDGAERIVDVAMRTSAAPTYFPSWQGYIDGGVVANNPAMAALAQALDRGTGGRRLGEVRLLSLGTGTNPQYIRGERLDWGLVAWARPILDVMMDGMMGVADYQCARLLGARYHRLAPFLPRRIAMDDVGRLGALERLACAVDLAPTANWVRRRFAGRRPGAA
jgi:patatin-like phospholipase/acyl hydrolase